jgi:hypothetical protein
MCVRAGSKYSKICYVGNVVYIILFVCVCVRARACAKQKIQRADNRMYVLYVGHVCTCLRIYMMYTGIRVDTSRGHEDTLITESAHACSCIYMYTYLVSKLPVYVLIEDWFTNRGLVYELRIGVTF